jgi:hypothetical protein
VSRRSRADRRYRDDLRSLATLADNAERDESDRLTAADLEYERDPNGYRSDEYGAYLNAQPFFWNGGRL